MSATKFGSGRYGSTRYGGFLEPTFLMTLHYHITNNENNYVVYWEIDPGYITPDVLTTDWELQLSTTPNFSTFISYPITPSTVGFEDGDPSKGFNIDLQSFVNNKLSVAYVRVRAIINSVPQTFSSILTIDIIPDFTEIIASAIMGYLISQVYNQDLLKLPPEQRNTNLYTIIRMLSNELSITIIENEKVKKDKSLENCRDEALYPNFGYNLRLTKPLSMSFVQYREVIRGAMNALLLQGTSSSIIYSVLPFTGVKPTITNFRDNIQFICVDLQTDPYVSYTGVTAGLPNSITTNVAAYGIEIFLNNPAGFSLDLISVTNTLNLAIPAHVYATIA